MSQGDADVFFMVGVSHHSAPLTIREQVTCDGARIRRLYSALCPRDAVVEILVLGTCNRTEIYAVGNPRSGPEAVVSALLAETGLSPTTWDGIARIHQGEVAVLHFLEVCAGLDSQIVGETEILGQVKDAYRLGTRQGGVGSILHRVCHRAFQAAKWVRSQTGIGSGQVSIGNVAVDLATRIFGDLRRSQVLIVGSGEVGRAVVKALHTRGAGEVRVSSRNPENALALATEVNATPVDFTQWREHLAEVDIAVFSTSAPEFLLSRNLMRATMDKRPGRPVFLIDVAVPRDVEASVDSLGDVFLYNMDDLAAIANENLTQRESEIVRGKTHLRERAGRLQQELALRGITF